MPSAAKPPTDLGAIFADNYPPAALRAEVQGRVGFSLDISPAGRVIGCLITSSSGNAELDAGTCSLMMRLVQFKPATDATGQPVVGHWASAVNWVLPAEPSATAAPPSRIVSGKVLAPSAISPAKQQWIVLRKDADLIFTADLAARSATGIYPMAVVLTPRGELDTAPDRPTIISVNGTPDCRLGKIAFSGSDPNVEALNQAGIQEKLQYSSPNWMPMICGGKGPSYRPLGSPATIWSIYGLFDNSGGADDGMGFIDMAPGRISFFRGAFPATVTHIVFYAGLPRGGHLEANRQVDCGARSISAPVFEFVDASASRSAMSRPEWVADATKEDDLLIKWRCDKLSTITITADYAYVEAAFRRYLAK